MLFGRSRFSKYRPIIAVHKWFARRQGTLFRGLLLSEFVDEPVEETYYRANRLDDVTIADPFMGGGTPLLEANRIGAEPIHFHLTEDAVIYAAENSGYSIRVGVVPQHFFRGSVAELGKRCRQPAHGLALVSKKPHCALPNSRTGDRDVHAWMISPIKSRRILLSYRPATSL